MVLCDIAKTRSSQQESTYSYASQIARKFGGQFVKLGYLLTPNRWLPRSKIRHHQLLTLTVLVCRNNSLVLGLFLICRLICRLFRLRFLLG